MLALSLLMVPLLLGPELFTLSESLKETFFVLDWFIWAVFALPLCFVWLLALSLSHVAWSWATRG